MLRRVHHAQATTKANYNTGQSSRGLSTKDVTAQVEPHLLSLATFKRHPGSGATLRDPKPHLFSVDFPFAVHAPEMSPQTPRSLMLWHIDTGRAHRYHLASNVPYEPGSAAEREFDSVEPSQRWHFEGC